MNYPPPRLVFWETTAGCNLRCIHCRRVTLADQLSPQDLTTSESFQMIDQIREVGRPVFVLSGGEPLFRSDIYEIARYATDAGLPVALAAGCGKRSEEVEPIVCKANECRYRTSGLLGEP